MMSHSRGTLLLAAGALLVLTAARTARAGAIDPRVADLVQAGALRAGLNVGNPVLATKDAASGELQGVSVDLSRALAIQLGVSLQLVSYPSVPTILLGLQNHALDISFLAIDPARAGDVDFSPPYMEVDNTYLVAGNSPIRSVADADQPGVRIAVQAKNAADLFLSKVLQHAMLVRADTEAAAFDLLRAGQADALASSRPALLGYAAQFPGSRVLADRFTAVQHAMAVPKGDLARLAYVSEFVEQAKASGLVQHALTRAGVQGVQPAPLSDPTPGQEALALFDRYFLAQNAHDLPTVSATLLDSPTSLWIDAGTPIWGREAALQQLSSVYQGTWHLAPDMGQFRITALGGDVARLYVPVDLTRGAPGQTPQTTHLLLNQVLVKNAGSWQIESSLPIPAAGP